MQLPTPKLDDRHFQDLVDEAKKRIPQYCKEWTDHNVSDPGVTLIELFAWMTDILLYRLNQVPDLHYIKFMEMLGIQLKPPVPASVPVSFWLSAPQANPVLIPKGTEVASTQIETKPSVIFTTSADFKIQPPVLKAVLSRTASNDGSKKVFSEINLRRLESGFEGFYIFSRAPQVDDALYFGFENDLSEHILGIDMDCDPAGGAGVDPTMPPYEWEASTGLEEPRWRRCEVESDTTKGMNVTGQIQIHLPRLGRYTTSGQNLYWVRVRVKEISALEAEQGMRPYQVSPRIRKAEVASWGGSTNATHSRTVVNEMVGVSDGSPGQRFRVQFTPILERQEEECLVVQVNGMLPHVWKEVADFASSTLVDEVYTLDGLSGEIRFGPAIREQDGTIKMYGAVPARDANLVFQKYRYGGGQEGNIQAGVLNTLKTAIPYLAKVKNREAAWGGLDAETLESAMMRVPELLRSRERAVTESDFEFLARQALPVSIGRVKCLQPIPAEAGKIVPGQVYVLVVPRIARADDYIAPEQLELDPEEMKRLTAFLDERRLLTTRMDIRAPVYMWVAVKVKLKISPGAKRESVEKAIKTRLNRFINPLTGGPEGKGWPFGRDLFVSDVYQCLQGLENVQFVRNIEMYNARPGGEPEGMPIEQIELVSHAVVTSGKHFVEFI